MNESELLFSELLTCDKLSLYQNRDLILDKDKTFLISSVLKRRISGEPIQYILGKTEFLGLEFKVNRDVFIPRPETEILVETAINIVKLLNCQTVKLLDIGTGSGNIAIALAKFLIDCKIIAVDISQEAIDIAQYNAKLNRVYERIRFIKSDLFAAYDLPLMTYDLIVSNPPYIVSAEIENLQPEIKYEPLIALDGGGDGLDFYRKIISESPNYLNKCAFLIMEMGFNQRKSIENILKKSENFKILEIIKDYNNIDRVIVSKKINSKH